MPARAHHSAIVVRDIEASLRFWRDGVGFEVMMDRYFDGDWSALFVAPSNRLRSVFLGDPARRDAGIVELVRFGDGDGDGDGDDLAADDLVADEAPPAFPVTRPGFFLLSCYVDVDIVLGRLRTLGLGGPPRRIVVPGLGGAVPMATVVDPDGVLVELVGRPAT
jgi:catechol 2,3-dioxygenase-like lactoylglutathione lyase family enzyme